MSSLAFETCQSNLSAYKCQTNSRYLFEADRCPLPCFSVYKCQQDEPAS